MQTSTAELARPAPENVAEAILGVLFEAGVRHIFYVPGGPLMPFLSAAFRRGGFQFVLARHESGAAFAAEGLARVTRRVALVAVTAGPGVTNLVTPVYVAYRELSPVFVVSAQVATPNIGRSAAQELDTVKLLAPITLLSECLSPNLDVRGRVRQLVAKTTTGRPGPVHLSVAADQWARSYR